MILRNNACLTRLATMVVMFMFSGCAEISGINLTELLKPTNVDRTSYQPVCEKSWNGKTIYVDFDVNRNYWGHSYASSLAYDIRDKLIEDVVADGCFHVTDKNIRRNFAYKVGVYVASPIIRADENRIISSVSAKYRIRTYDNKDNLVDASSRKIKYERPSFAVVSGGSQDELLENYTHNVSVEIRKMFYNSLRDNVSNRSSKKQRESSTKKMSAQSRNINLDGKYKTISNVRFRSKPVDGKTITMLPKGTNVTPTGDKKGKWWKAKAKGKIGWVHSDYIH